MVALSENVGFGRANNRGLAEVSEAAAVLVNPDVELLDDSLRALADQAALHPGRLLAPLVLYPDGRRQDTVHPLPASAQDFVRALVPGALLPGPVGVWLEPWRSPRPRQVGWAVGCALAARTDTLQIACTECDRVGRYPLDTLIQRYGSGVRIPDLLRVLSAGCPMRESVSPYALCGCHVSELSAPVLQRL